MTEIVAIDQGTTSTRTLGIEAEGSVRILNSRRHAQRNPQPGWVEQDAEELLGNILACFAGSEGVRAIGLSNQGESCLAWHAETGKPLSPVITWQDSRTSDVIAALAADGAEPLVKQKTGLPLDPYFSASKLGWLMKSNAAVTDAARDGKLRLGTTDAFFLDRLTGVFATDVTTASRTSLMDLATCQWDAELCALFGVPMDALPEIRPTAGDFGRWNRIPVTAAIVDQQAALYGHGCRRAGDAKITFGTGAFCLAVVDSHAQAVSAEGGLLPTVAWRIGDQTSYALDGGVYDAGSAIEWAIDGGFAKSYEDFDHFADPPAIDRDLIFVPAFSGLACPFWDRSASPMMIGLSPASGLADIRQALLEGIAMLTAEIVTLMHKGVRISSRISIDGGVTRSSYFCQFLADCLEREVVIPAFDELTALGTALMAAKGAGIDVTPRFAAQELVYRPRPGQYAARRTKFLDAVGRSRGWRQPGVQAP